MRKILWLGLILLFSCKKDDTVIPCECAETSRIEINSETGIVNEISFLNCHTKNEGDHLSAMYFNNPNRINLNFGSVSHFTIQTSSKVEGAYEIINYLDHGNGSLPDGKGIAFVQVYEDTTMFSPEDHYAINSGIISVWERGNGEIVKCIRNGVFTSTSDASKSFTGSLTLVCDE